MANARMISRDFFTSADLTDLPWWGHLLFAGMIVFADDAGVIRGDPGYLRNLALAWRGHGSARADRGPRRVPSLAAVRLVLGQLVDRGCLELGNFENVSCYKITNFAQFQRLKRREGKRREVEAEGIAVEVSHSEPTVPERLCDEFHFGTPKALELFERWQYTHDDLNAWIQFEGGGKGTRLRNHLMKSAKNPKDVEAFESRNGTSSAHQSSMNEQGKFDHLT